IKRGWRSSPLSRLRAASVKQAALPVLASAGGGHNAFSRSSNRLRPNDRNDKRGLRSFRSFGRTPFQQATQTSEDRPPVSRRSQRARPYSAKTARARHIVSVGRLRWKRSRISVRVRPAGADRSARRSSSATGSPSESPQTKRTDAS